MMWPFRQTQIPYHFYIIFLMRVLACSLIFTPKFTLLQNRFLGAARNPLLGQFGQPPLLNRLYESCIYRCGSQAAPTNRFVGAARITAAPDIYTKIYTTTESIFRGGS